VENRRLGSPTIGTITLATECPLTLPALLSCYLVRVLRNPRSATVADPMEARLKTVESSQNTTVGGIMWVQQWLITDLEGWELISEESFFLPTNGEHFGHLVLNRKSENHNTFYC